MIPKRRPIGRIHRPIPIKITPHTVIPRRIIRTERITKSRPVLRTHMTITINIPVTLRRRMPTAYHPDLIGSHIDNRRPITVAIHHASVTVNVNIACLAARITRIDTRRIQSQMIIALLPLPHLPHPCPHKARITNQISPSPSQGPAARHVNR